MNILRLPPKSSIYFEIDDPFFSVGKQYPITLSDEKGLDTKEYVGSGVVIGGAELVEWSDWPSTYDEEYLVEITGLNTDTNEQDLLVSETLSVVRPYINVAKEYPGKDVEEYRKFEAIARMVIDGVTKSGFYYKKKTFQKVSSGSDVLMFGYPVRKLVEVVENGEVVYDEDTDVYGYVLSRDGLYLTTDDAGNVSEGHPIVFPTGRSDSYPTYSYGVQFGSGYTYTITAEVGYIFVPSDIQECAKRIIDQLACGVPNYAQQYMKKYETDEFRVDFDSRAFKGTGDMVIDHILHKYWTKSLFHNIGVL